MKQHALALFGNCLGLLGLTAKSQATQEQPHADQSSCEIDCNRSIAAVSLVNIGVVALDYPPLQGEPCGSGTERQPRGPARIVASVG